MSHDDLFHGSAHRGSDFAFDEKVARVFDDMLARSIPLYAEQQRMIGDIARRFWVEDTRVADLGCSLGTTLINIAGLLPDHAALCGYDNAEAMLQRAASSITDQSNVRLQLKDFAELPARRVFDAIAAAMVLHHQPSPLAFFQQGFRVLKPGGVLIIVDLCRHDQEWVKKVCGDFWLGFEPDELMHWGERAGFASPASQYLTQNNGFQLQLHAFSKQ